MVEGFRTGTNYTVDAETRGDRGNQKFKIQLNSKAPAKVDAVASEGEQKCLALAGIFAELKIDRRKSGVVFDDPVNSMDHKWRRKIAKRLSDESINRQVIVFTHDLPFLKMLEEVSEKILIKALTRTRIETGVPTDNPPWDALKTHARVKWLKNEYQKLNSVSNHGTEEKYNEDVKRFYGKKRET